ncbi:MAG: hypothetical protein VX460_06650 [Planctomycetota bacterium]|nr:hypothetical protein [Planctomycetota bacterium]
MLKLLLLYSLAALAIGGGLLFWHYGLDSHHETPDSLYPALDDRIISLTPPEARDITLQRDVLDHFATYTIEEKDLTSFLDGHFQIEDSFTERSLVGSDLVGRAIGRLDWVVPDGCVTYSYAASNGGVSTYYHDPATGSTYQDSAHW